MNDDVRTTIYRTLTFFVVGIVIWLGILFVNACGMSLTCQKGAAVIVRTPIPTMIPANMPAAAMDSKPADTSDKCQVAAADLIGAWVSAGSPEADAFEFTAADMRVCQATFADVQPLFAGQNFWYAAAPSCTSCHSADFNSSKAKLDLTSYAGIQSGSQRADAESKGADILGGGKWESSLLYQFIAEAKADVKGHTTSLMNVLVYAGSPVPVATPTP